MEWKRYFWSYPAGMRQIRFMRCFRRKRLHLILAASWENSIDLLVQYRNKLAHLGSKAINDGENLAIETICQDSEDSSRWLVGGYDDEATKGFIKSIRIVYK